MESSAPAAVPWVVLGLALLALAALAAAQLARGRGRSDGAAPEVPQPPAPPPPRWAHDDLPGFLDAPPGIPAGPPAAAVEGEPEAAAPAAGDAPTGRVVAAMAAAALVLVAVLAAVAGSTDDAGDPAASPAPPSGGTPTAGPTVTPAPTATTLPVPELPGVPADPLPGESGAGALANLSVPPGEEGVTARLAFGAIVVERHAVGVTVAEPLVSVSARGDGTAALAHVRMPTWNCMTDRAPADPEEAGCARATTEYADLPSPALTVTREGERLRVSGRFPTYTRPIGTAPAYTGRVYELAVTAAPAGRVQEGRATAEGTLFLGTDRVGTVDDAALNRLGYGD
ncbi:hypothetical protein [Geodermatophilus sp. CPCC 206100]|uniref:hypothetical protein n=1 Tax=Geodermatophilus sp. CPCC 206100 TaxID=3020054 RepID=UPI003AFFC235